MVDSTDFLSISSLNYSKNLYSGLILVRLHFASSSIKPEHMLQLTHQKLCAVSLYKNQVESKWHRSFSPGLKVAMARGLAEWFSGEQISLLSLLTMAEHPGSHFIYLIISQTNCTKRFLNGLTDCSDPPCKESEFISSFLRHNTTLITVHHVSSLLGFI